MSFRQNFVRAALVAGGILYVLTGAALLFAPEWFFQNVGNYPPYNPHYAGDVGAFTLPLGVALLWAARSPAQHRSLIVFAAGASLVHAANHVLDDLVRQTPDLDVFTPVSLLVFGLALAAAYLAVRPADSRGLSNEG